MRYYVVKDKNTGLLYRGKGVNKWGKYYNQVSVYRMKAHADNTVEEESRRGVQAEVIPIQIFENTAELTEVKRGKWIIKRDDYDYEYMKCSCCKEEFYPPYDEDTVDTTPNYCGNCGARMMGKTRLMYKLQRSDK